MCRHTVIHHLLYQTYDKLHHLLKSMLPNLWKQTSSYCPLLESEDVSDDSVTEIRNGSLLYYANHCGGVLCSNFTPGQCLFVVVV